MEFPFNRSSQSQSISTTSNERTNSSPWRSIFSRRIISASSTETFYPQRDPSSDPRSQRHMVSYNQSYHLPQHHKLGRSSSILSWSPFRKKNRIEYDSPNLTAREVYHQRKVKKSIIPHIYPSRSKTIDTRRQIPIITPILHDPLDQWPNNGRSFHQVDFQSPIGPDEASEAIFTLTEPPDPEAKITVQYSPRESSWDRTERRTGLDVSIPQIQDLGEHDSDKRNEVFARIHAEGWNRIIPKQWVENEFSEDGAKTTASRSLYSGDESENPRNGEQLEHTARTRVEPKRRSEPSPKPTSRLTKTSSPRFVFEDSDDEAELRQTQSESQGDQAWWETLTSPLSLSSTPYHQNQECPASHLPSPIEAVSQLKRSDNDKAPLLRSSLPSDTSQRKEHNVLSKSHETTKSYTSPPCLVQESRMSPQNKARRLVDEFFNLVDAKSLYPPPLKPRHQETNCEQSPETEDGANRQTPGEAPTSPETSWETIQCAGEEVTGRYDINPDTHIDPRATVSSEPKHTNNSVRKQMGPKQISNFVGNELEESVNHILDLYFTEDEAEDDSGYAISHQPSLQNWGKVTSPEPEDTNPAPTTAPQSNNRNQHPFPPPIPPARSSRGIPSRGRNHEEPADKPPQREESTLSTKTRTATTATHPRPSFLRQQALFPGDCPQSPSIWRWNGSVEERRETSSGARLPVTHIDEFGNTWI